MPKPDSPRVAIIDYGLGNLFSVKHACEHAGMQASVTNSSDEILAAEAVILPGMGAFGDAMDNLRSLDLIGPLRDTVASGKPLIGVCLGMQLIMTEGFEFGRHKGLGFIEGDVVKFDNPVEGPVKLKVPQIEWNNIYRTRRIQNGDQDPWADSPLEGLADNEYMYFVHSYHARPESQNVMLSASQYGQIEFCSSLQHGNIFAFQFHPERSGPQGLVIYRNLASLIERSRNTSNPGENSQA